MYNFNETLFLNISRLRKRRVAIDQGRSISVSFNSHFIKKIIGDLLAVKACQLLRT